MSSCIYYKDYIGSVEYSEESQVFHGKVIGIKASISYEGDSVTSFNQDFHDAVDEYLAHCEETGIQPQKAFKGSFNVRIQSELHRSAALKAASNGLSLNSFVEDAIRHAI